MKIQNQKTKRESRDFSLNPQTAPLDPRQAGFTLLEILVASAIIAGIMLFVAYFGNDLVKSNIRVNTTLLTQQEMQQAIQLMIPEIVSVSQSNSGNYPIEAAATTSLTLYSDIDRDGKFDRVRYYLEGS